MVLQFPLSEQQRWQLFSKLQGVNLLLMVMFLASSIYQHSPVRYLLFMAYAALWVSGILIPSEKMHRFFWLNVLMLLVCLYLGPSLV